MLASDDELRCDVLYMGPGNGCRHVLRCEVIGFTTELDCHNHKQSMQDAVEEIDGLLFQAFRNGDHQFQPEERQQKAMSCVEQSDDDLIDCMYDTDWFIAEIVKREMTRRGIWDDGIHRIGKFSNAMAQSQAISIMKSQASTAQGTPIENSSSDLKRKTHG